MSAPDPTSEDHHGRRETRAAIAALDAADMTRLVAAAKTRVRRSRLDAVDLGARDLVADAITGTLRGRRRWCRGVTLIRHLIMTMKSIASQRSKRVMAAKAAGFCVERRAELAPGLLPEKDREGNATDLAMMEPSLEPDAERVIARDEIRMFYRHFANDPAALAVMDGWKEGVPGPKIQERSGLEFHQYQAAARRVRRFAQRQGDNADGG